MGLIGRYRLQVVDAATQEVVADHGWHKNLITNVGMNAIASTAIASLTAVAVGGSGSRPNCITGSTMTITQSGYFIGVSSFGDRASFTQSISQSIGGQYYYTSSISRGDIIMDEDFSQSMVIGVSGSIMAVNVSSSFDTPKSFSIWKTSQAKIQNEFSRSSTYYVSDIGWNTGTDTSQVLSGTWVHRRTYDFGIESGATRSYTEVGVRWSSTPNSDIFSRVLLPSSVDVSPGQLLRMTYDLIVNVSPTGSVYRTASISGWPKPPATDTLCTESIQNLGYTYVNSNGGNSVYASYYSSLDPQFGSYGGNHGFYCFLSADSRSLNNYGTASDRGSIATQFVTVTAGSMDSYIPESFTVTRTVTFPITAYTSSFNHIGTIGFGCYYYGGFSGIFAQPYWAGHQGYCLRLNQSQSKLNTETLTLKWRWRWERVLQ